MLIYTLKYIRYMNKEKTLVIGGTGSLGKILVEKLVKNGNDVISTSTIKKKNDTSYLNFEDKKSIKKLSQSIDQINHLIFASGYEPKLNLEKYDNSHAAKMLNIHVVAPLNLISQLKDKIINGGSIIFISSVAAYKGSYDPAYAAAKGAINAMTRSLAKELAPDLRVNAIAPSLVYDSKVYKGMTSDFRTNHLNDTLLNKFLSTNECSDSIMFLMKNNHITGEVLQINGGQYFV